MRVGLVTTWNMACGIAEYSRNLIQYSAGRDLEYKVISYPYSFGHIFQETRDCDVINFQYESGFLGIFSPGVMKAFQKPTVLTLHDSYSENNRSIYPFTNEADRVIVHQDTNDGFIKIPQPIAVAPERHIARVNVVATVGFPLPHKGFEVAAQAVKILCDRREVLGGKFIAPRNPHCDTYRMGSVVRNICPEIEYVTEWYEQAQVIELLSQCSVCVFPYNLQSKPGISSAVRLGLASRASIVLSRCNQFCDLYDYEDEIEFVKGELSVESLAEAISSVLKSRKRPNRLLKDMSWERAALLYRQVYEDALKGVCV